MHLHQLIVPGDFLPARHNLEGKTQSHAFDRRPNHGQSGRLENDTILHTLLHENTIINYGGNIQLG